MRVVSVQLRDFRTYARAEAHLGEGLTVVHGPNGAGKSNLLEALYFGCTGRSPRTRNERELVRFGAQATRVVVQLADGARAHELSVGFEPGQPKRMSSDGAPVERLLDVETRPLLSVFVPDRLELLKGAPAVRRSHLDQFVAAVWPARAADRLAYSRVLAQRNALLGGIRAGRASRETISTWDRQLARQAMTLARAPRRRGGAARRAVRASAHPSSAWSASRASTTARARAPRTRRSSSPSCRRAWRAISSVASPLMVPTATSWPSCATGASCACTARRASSAWPCSRCCSPSARCSPASAAARR